MRKKNHAFTHKNAVPSVRSLIKGRTKVVMVLLVMVTFWQDCVQFPNQEFLFSLPLSTCPTIVVPQAWNDEAAGGVWLEMLVWGGIAKSTFRYIIKVLCKMDVYWIFVFSYTMGFLSQCVRAGIN